MQQRSSKVLEERSTKRLLEAGNLYQSFTTLGLEPQNLRRIFVATLFQVLCPVCREPIGESRYNLSELLNADPPVSEQTEPVSYSISEDVREMQRNMEKLFIKQKEKGGIIDLEEEQKKFLVVTNNGEQESEENKFTELSPTDYQLGLF